jgi:CheY-like chemotaxis protein
VEEVLEAFTSDRLDEPQYCSPGIGGEKHVLPQHTSERAPHVGSVEGTQVSAGGQPPTRADTTSEAKPKVRILLLESNIASQQSALDIFQKCGCQVHAVTNGREAIKALETVTYDFVFMDADMPEMDGYKATRVIRDPRSGVRCHDVPVIAMTRDPGEQDRKRFIEAGMNHCIAE